MVVVMMVVVSDGGVGRYGDDGDGVGVTMWRM
jgi:hypothetical protein